MARKDTLDAWRRRPSPEKWEAAGEGFLVRARREQSIGGASWGNFWQFGRPAELDRRKGKNR
jgi:hypothetical protein